MWIVMEGDLELRFEMPDARRTTHENTLSSHNRDNPESQIFGRPCFTPPYKMKLSAYCTSRRCQVLKINAGELNHLMEKDTSIGFKMMRYREPQNTKKNLRIISSDYEHSIPCAFWLSEAPGLYPL
jgi:hypothetical protein